MKKAYLLYLILFCIYNTCWSQIPAFPGAEGFGANTVGGRGGSVIKVTNLNDRGPGSLRAAIETEGPRIVIFAVGGIINLETELSIRNPFITIAGQTAPGDGICLRGECLRIYTHDVVVRYLRTRPGDINFGPVNIWQDIDAISIRGNAYNVVIDHCSLSWAVDENLEVWQNAHDITIQNCIIAEALNRSRHPNGAHSMGMIIGSKTTNISVHHNIFAHNNDRNPHVNGPSKVDFRNNIIYNAGLRASDFDGRAGQQINFVNNYTIKGLDTNIKTDIILRNPDIDTPKLYVKGNIGTIGNNPDDDNWSLVRHDDNARPKPTMQMKAEFPHPHITTLSAKLALEHVVNNAGATLPLRDPVDKKIIRDLLKKKGHVIHRKYNLIEWPPMQAGFFPLDRDNDGMPDHWEEKYGFELEYDDSSDDPDRDGYTNIEEFLNGTSPNSTTSPSVARTFMSNADTGDDLQSQLKFDIEMNYPNPYNSYTNIKFSIDLPSYVTIKIFNNDGKEVTELVNSFLYEGKYEITWDSRDVKPGFYNIVMASADKIKAIKSLLSY